MAGFVQGTIHLSETLPRWWAPGMDAAVGMTRDRDNALSCTNLACLL
jgi:hypothetical protein